MHRLCQILQVLMLLFSGFLFAFPARAEPPSADTVDLHAHLFFYEGLGLSWFGEFNREIKVDRWDTRLGSKVNAGALEQSGVGLIVVALYAHPLFMGNMRDGIRRQIQAAKDFLSTHPDWILATEPGQAEAAVKGGKKVLVFSLEGASGILENEGDLAEFIDYQGIRIVSLVHFTDDAVGGPALMPGLRAVASPIGWFRSWFASDANENVLGNPLGLTPAGKELVQSLLKRRIWIDLSHSSDELQKVLTPILVAAGQPILHTHTALRKYYRAERGISIEQIQAVKKTAGMIGLLASDEMMRGTRVDEKFCDPKPQPWEDESIGGLPALASQYSEMLKALNGEGTLTLSSDINAPLPFLKPDVRCGTGFQGTWEYSQMKTVWGSLRDQVKKQTLFSRLDRMGFVRKWARVRN